MSGRGPRVVGPRRSEEWEVLEAGAGGVWEHEGRSGTPAGPQPQVHPYFAQQHPQQQPQGGLGVSPPSKPAGNTPRAPRTSVNAVRTARPASASTLGGGGMGSPAFEVRGASMLPPEAAPPLRPGSARLAAPAAATHQQHHGGEPLARPTFHLQARAGGYPVPYQRAGSPSPGMAAAWTPYSSTRTTPAWQAPPKGNEAAGALQQAPHFSRVAQNPLYGSDSFGLSYSGLARAGNSGTGALAPAGTPGGSPLSSHAGSPNGAFLRAASNMTIFSDGRPASPGPYLSTYPSSAQPGSASSSRPASPALIDSQPGTPGGSVGSAAPPASRPFRNLSPLKTLSAAAREVAARARSLPASPLTGAGLRSSAMAAQPAAAAPPGDGGSGSGEAASAEPPLPQAIFNQDGKLVGFRQQQQGASLGPKPKPAAAPASAPASPGYPLGAAPAVPHPAVAAAPLPLPSTAAAAPPPAAVPLVPTPSTAEAFAPYAAEPCRGFPDEDNMVAGYVLGPLLGKGGFCSVRRALHMLTGRSVACKVIEKARLKDPKDRDRVDRECRVMRNLSNHACIVRLYECVETRDCIFLMMEHCERGSLLDYVRDKKKLPEAEVQTLVQQLLHALQYCHRKDVVHRDIKLENILIDREGTLKLIDFGLCGYYVPGKHLRCHCGSPSYAAPEIVARKDYLGPSVDVWSLGVVLFAALAGHLPFHAKEKRHLSEKILSGQYKAPAGMSTGAQDLLARMLCLDPEQRITLEGVWAHPWVAATPRWAPPGVGPDRLARTHADATSGAVLPDDTVVAQLEGLGLEGGAVRRALRTRECNSLTASYHLLWEARQQQLPAGQAPQAGQQVLELAAVAAGDAAAGDWHWDFSAATPRGGDSSSAASSNPSAAGAPAPRPRTAAAAPASPSRFHAEAAAARVAGSTVAAAPPPPSAVLAVQAKLRQQWLPATGVAEGPQQAAVMPAGLDRNGTLPHGLLAQAAAAAWEAPAADGDAFFIRAVRHEQEAQQPSQQGAAAAAAGAAAWAPAQHAQRVKLGGPRPKSAGAAPKQVAPAALGAQQPQSTSSCRRC